MTTMTSVTVNSERYPVNVEHDDKVPTEVVLTVVRIADRVNEMVVGLPVGSVTLRLDDADVVKYAREPWRTELWHHNTGWSFTIVRGMFDDDEDVVTYRVTTTNAD